MSHINTAFSKKIQSLATNIAMKSPCIHKHGSVITRGNKIMACGYNDNRRTCFLGKHDCCMHAEMSAALQFINNCVLRNKKKYCF